MRAYSAKRAHLDQRSIRGGRQRMLDERYDDVEDDDGDMT